MRLARDFAQAALRLANSEELGQLMDVASREMGFRYFALMRHRTGVHQKRPAIRLHNYPDGWAEWFDEKRLGRNDPVHRASQRSSRGFARSRLPKLISLTPRDREVFDEARQNGLGDGFTVPAHVAGEARSCSFAIRSGGTVSDSLNGWRNSSARSPSKERGGSSGR